MTTPQYTPSNLETAVEKRINEAQTNGQHVENSGMRARRQNLDRNHISLRDYDRAIGGADWDDDGVEIAGVSSSASRPSLRSRSHNSHHERKHIRRRLKQKHKSKIPEHVKWTQWIHSDSKNRKWF